jgi:hypothetical protein
MYEVVPRFCWPVSGGWHLAWRIPKNDRSSADQCVLTAELDRGRELCPATDRVTTSPSKVRRWLQAKGDLNHQLALAKPQVVAVPICGVSPRGHQIRSHGIAPGTHSWGGSWCESYRLRHGVHHQAPTTSPRNDRDTPERVTQGEGVRRGSTRSPSGGSTSMRRSRPGRPRTRRPSRRAPASSPRSTSAATRAPGPP